jgi:hypothetical protein
MNIAGGQTWLKDQVFTNDGIAATYTRGDTVLSITVVPARTQWEVTNELSPAIFSDSSDFFVKESELTSLGEPQNGDRIAYDGDVFDVMSLQGGDHPWQWADPANRSTYRVHTKSSDPEK